VTVFFHHRAPRLDDRPVTGYAGIDEHMTDLLELAARWLDRAAAVARLRGVATTTMSAVDAPLAAIDAQVAEAARWVEARLAASSTALPLGELVLRCGLSETCVQILSLLVAIELDATLLQRLGSPAPLGLDATALYSALAWPGTPLPRWLGSYLGPDAPLVAAGLVRFDDVPVPVSRRPLIIARPALQRIAGLAVGDELEGAIVRPASDYADHPQAAELVSVMRTGGAGIALWISGPGPRLELAAAVARADRRRAVIVDAAALARDVTARQRAAIVATIALEQRIDDRAVILRVDDGAEAEAVRAARLVRSQLPGACILVSVNEHAALAQLAVSAHRYAFPRLDARRRHDEWVRHLGASGPELGDGALAQLAADFPLDASEIEEIVHAVTRSGGERSIERLRATALARQRSRLGHLTQFVPHGFTWDDLVLPDEDLARLREILARQQHRELVFGRWNMASKVPYGTGTAALFAGPPGTGKTMAASVIAKLIGRELYRIDLSRVVDKYIGETEKNLGAIFDAAVDANAILLFDEADSLFAKRTQVSSSHDRYANLETNYLLQRIEEHPGISILTTNNAQSIDPAFARRIQFRVEFPFPDAKSRAEIWRRCLTPEVPREPDLDYESLGEAFELSGANIKAAVLRAAFGAATSGDPITTISLADAAAREFENAGKLPPAFRWPRR